MVYYFWHVYFMNHSLHSRVPKIILLHLLLYRYEHPIAFWFLSLQSCLEKTDETFYTLVVILEAAFQLRSQERSLSNTAHRYFCIFLVLWILTCFYYVASCWFVTLIWFFHKFLLTLYEVLLPKSYISRRELKLNSSVSKGKRKTWHEKVNGPS